MIRNFKLVVMLTAITGSVFPIQSSPIIRAIMRNSAVLRYPMGGIIQTNNERANYSHNSIASKQNSLAIIGNRSIMVMKNVDNSLAVHQTSVGIKTLDDFIKDVRDGSPIYSKLSVWEKMHLLYHLSCENSTALDKK